MVSFYRLRYTNFISSDNYLVGNPREINPESRFLALGARKGYVIADLNYSCFLARRASLFLFGSLVRRSHPAVSFGYRFYDYESLFSEFSSLSLSYVRDWVPGLLTNYRVLFRTALKEEGALRRIGFFFQFPDILLMFGANDSIGFIVNEARAIRIPTIATGDTSISFSRITYMLLSNYKSFKSTVFFVRLFLDLNAESRRFRVLRHYSIFKRFIKGIFLRRTLKAKLFSIKLARMFFIFNSVPGFRVSQITPVVYTRAGWRSARFFKSSIERGGVMRRSLMRKSRIGSSGWVVPIRKREYVAERRIQLGHQGLLPTIVPKLRRNRAVLARKLRALPKRVPTNSLVARAKKARALKRNIAKAKLLRRRRVKGFITKFIGVNEPKRFRKLLTVAQRKGLRVKRLFEVAELLSNRLRKLNNPTNSRSRGIFLPIRMVERNAFSKAFPFFGYFAYGYMAKRLNTLFFYRAVFRQIIQKRKRVLRLKNFTSDLAVIGVQAKKFRALNLAINRRGPSIWKLRARVKKLGEKLRTFSKLNKLRKLPGFDEKLYMRKFLKRGRFGKSRKHGGSDEIRDDKRKMDGYRKGYGRADTRLSGKNSKVKADKRYDESRPLSSREPVHYNTDSQRLSKAKGVFAGLVDVFNKQDGPNPDKPKWLKDLERLNKGNYKVLKGGSKLKAKKRKSRVLPGKGKEPKLIAKLASATLTGNRRSLIVRNFTPAQRHILRLYRVLSVRYPSFVKKSEAELSLNRRTFLFPRTLRQFIIKSRRLKSEEFRKRTGRVLKFRRTIESLIPKPPKSGFRSKQRGGRPWNRNKGKGFSGPGRDFRKPLYNSSYAIGKDWNRGGGRLDRNNRKADDLSKKPYHKTDYRNRYSSEDRYPYGRAPSNLGYGSKVIKGGGTRSYNLNYSKEKDWHDKYGKGRRRDSNAPYSPDYKNRYSWGRGGKRGNDNKLDRNNRKADDLSKKPYHKTDYRNRYDRGSRDQNPGVVAYNYSVRKDGDYPKESRAPSFKNKDSSSKAPYNLGQDRGVSRRSKDKVNGALNTHQSGEDVLNQPDYCKPKKSPGKKGAQKTAVFVTDVDLPDIGVRKVRKKGPNRDKEPQNGGKG